MSTGAESTLRLNRSHAGKAVEVLIRAFWEHPPLQYYFPDESGRSTVAPYFFSMPVLHGIRYGEVYAPCENLEGIAVWLRSDYYPVSAWRLLRSVPLSQIIGFGRHGGARLRPLGRHIDAVHHRMAPYRHWYLEALSVSPEFQGKGYAGTLLRTMLQRTDREGLPCYLDTLEEKNVRLYEHFGFKVVDESRVPATSLVSWAMVRTCP